MAGQPGRSGGRRPGAGRKPVAGGKFAPERNAMDQALAANLEKYTDAIDQLAEGGFEQVTETWAAAATVQVTETRDIVDEDGAPTGKVAKHVVQAFPDKEPDEMVLVRKTVSIAAANLAANMYLINRVAGTPTTMEEAEEEETITPADLSLLTDEELDEYIRLTAKCTGHAAAPGGQGKTFPR